MNLGLSVRRTAFSSVSPKFKAGGPCIRQGSPEQILGLFAIEAVREEALDNLVDGPLDFRAHRERENDLGMLDVVGRGHAVRRFHLSASTNGPARHTALHEAVANGFLGRR